MVEKEGLKEKNGTLFHCSYRDCLLLLDLMRTCALLKLPTPRNMQLSRKGLNRLQHMIQKCVWPRDAGRAV